MGLRRRFLQWLAREASQERRRLDFADRAAFDDSVIFSSEAMVENYHGAPGRVVIGSHSYIRGRLLTYGHGGRIALGEWCYVGARTEIWSMDSIHIGKRVLIAHDVNIHDGMGHSLDAAQRHAHFRRILEKGHPREAGELPGVESAPIVIEDDVWISFGVTVLKGARIGAGSVIAACSLVTGDVPPRSLYRCQVTPIITPLDKAGAT
jgi:maltose O-acetyltransferase